MILSDRSIRASCKKPFNLIVPYNEAQLQPCSYDLTLDPGVGNNSVTLEPGEFKLLSTLEKVNVPDYLQGSIYGRSSIGRLGVFIHISAGFVDAGFCGTLTLECFNASQARWVGTRGFAIAQIAFARLDHPAEGPYKGRYQNQQGVTGSRLWL